MALDCLYSTFAARMAEADSAGIDAVVASAISGVRPWLQFAILVAVTAGGFAVTFNRMTAERLGVWMVRALTVVWLLSAAGTYNQVVRTAAMDEVPNRVASIVNGGGQNIKAEQQFCVLRAAMENLTAKVAKEANGWSVADFMARGSAEVARVAQGILLEVVLVIWLIGRRLTALAICLGPFLLCFELFDATRGFVRHWIGTVVGLLAFQLASSVQLQISQQGAMRFLQQLRGQMNGDINAMVGVLWDAVGWFLMDAVVMLAIPTICAVGSGVAVQTAASSQVVRNMVGGAARLGNRAVGAVSNAGRVVRARAARATGTI